MRLREFFSENYATNTHLGMGKERYQDQQLLEQPSEQVRQLQQQLLDLGYDLGRYGPKGDGIDGLMGPYTQAALDAYNKKIPPEQVAKPDATELDTFDRKHKSSGNNSGGLPAQGPITGEYNRIVRMPDGSMGHHPGVDIGAHEGSDVTSPVDGKIIFAGPANTAGNLIELMGTNGEKHRFMHLSKILVKTGEQVDKGDVIGLVGNTGYSHGAHLHWEKYASNGSQTNPIA